MNRFQKAGKLGNIKSQATHQYNKLKRIENYNKFPKNCLYCKKIIEYKNRQHKFCSRKCNGSYQATKIGYILLPDHVFCKHCGKEIIHNKKNNFCGMQCDNKYRRKETFKKIEACTGNRDKVDPKQFRRYLIEKHGPKCIKCGWSEMNQFSNTIPIVMNHIDGNPDNFLASNLELLCPNCDSMTPTYKGLNKGHGRYSRKMRYKNGQSF